MRLSKKLKKPLKPNHNQLVRLDNQFYQQDTIQLAKELLGKYLIYDSTEGKVGGIITEVEAYLGNFDPAAHSFKGQNKKNWALFGPSGTAYIYFTYGVHYCFNVVANKEGIGDGILIRSLEPMIGIELMIKNRRTDNISNLTTGPGKLVQALDIDPKLNGSDLVTGPIGIYQDLEKKPVDIEVSTRIGISKGQESLLRFMVKDNSFVSIKLRKIT